MTTLPSSQTDRVITSDLIDASPFKAAEAVLVILTTAGAILGGVFLLLSGVR